MAWLIIAASVVAIAAACSHMQNEYRKEPKYVRELPGTDCSVFNYSKRCCLPDARCIAFSNTNCSCSPHCYSSSKAKCCKDIHCPIGEDPTTCQDFGCCYENFNSKQCGGAPLLNENGEIIDYEDGVNCWNKTKSCPKTCFDAKKSTGYCTWQYRNVSCYVEQGRCYCDRLCIYFKDCCEDVKGLFNLRGRYQHLMLIMSLLTAADEQGDHPSQYELGLSARLMNKKNV